MMPTIDAPAPSAAIDLEVMREHATQVVTTLKLLGNADRLLLLCQLAQQERTVGDLEQLTGVGILRREGVVSTRRDGKFIWYQLNDPRILQLIQTMYRLYCPA